MQQFIVRNLLNSELWRSRSQTRYSTSPHQRSTSEPHHTSEQKKNN